MSSAKEPSLRLQTAVSDETPVKSAVPEGAREAVDVEKIMRGRKTVNLLHRGEVYRLQVTKQGRLLLTK